MRRQHGATTIDGYERIGRSSREEILSLLPPTWGFDGKRVLDFGAGAGRTVRHFLSEAERCELWACDIDGPSVDYLRAHLSPPVRVLRNEPEPPLPVPDGYFDLIWTVSVFTHLTTGWAAWLAELHRALRDRGLLIVTYAGEAVARRKPIHEPWDEDKAGMCVMYEGVPFAETPGPAVWHSRWWLEEHWGRAFKILKHKPRGFAHGRPGQGVLLMRKRPRRITAEDLERINPNEPRETEALLHQIRALLGEVAVLRDAQLRLRRDDQAAESQGAKPRLLAGRAERARARPARHARTGQVTLRRRGRRLLNALGAPARLSRSPGGLRALESRFVWIFGSPRSGSSWLMRLLNARGGIATINEPYLGAHLVPMGSSVVEGEYFSHGPRAQDPSYFFARRYMPSMRPLLHDLLLQGLENQLGELGAEQPSWVVIKEPNGSHAADTIVSILPDSRMIFLLRDGRDVVDSLLDAMLSEGSWWAREHARSVGGPPKGRLPFVRQHSTAWLHRTIATERAFATLPEDQRLLVRYESMLSGTAEELVRIYDWLGLDVTGAEVEETVASQAFDAAPEEGRGPGRAMRAASPGLWRQNLDDGEQQVLHEIMGEKLRELGYET